MFTLLPTLNHAPDLVRPTRLSSTPGRKSQALYHNSWALLPLTHHSGHLAFFLVSCSFSELFWSRGFGVCCSLYLESWFLPTFGLLITITFQDWNWISHAGESRSFSLYWIINSIVLVGDFKNYSNCSHIPVRPTPVPPVDTWNHR